MNQCYKYDIKYFITSNFSQCLTTSICGHLSGPSTAFCWWVLVAWWVGASSQFIQLEFWIRSSTPTPSTSPNLNPYPNPDPNPWMCPHPGASMALSFINLSGIQHNSIWPQVERSALAAVRTYVHMYVCMCVCQEPPFRIHHPASTILHPPSSIQHPAHLH